jgi:hypothetical protein
MDKLVVRLKHCYGIHKFENDFDFSSPEDRSKKAKAYAIYAPNGLMKTSFSKTFEKVSRGESPKEERYDRPSEWFIEADGSAISPNQIFVLKSEIDIGEESNAVTNILVNPESKSRYDSLLVEIEKQKGKVINSLQKVSKNKKAEIEQILLKDFGETDFAVCIEKIKQHSISDDLAPYEYAVIFDPKTSEVLRSQEFVTKAKEFNERYQELFLQAGTIYQKGIFNPIRAETSFATLEKQGFFAGGHRVHFRNEPSSIDKAELDQKIQTIHARIDGDLELKKLRESLAKNAQTQALMDLIENLSPTHVEFLLDKLKQENQPQFRRDLWSYYLQDSTDAAAYLESYKSNKDELKRIEDDAALNAPRWTFAVDRFNDRFVDMPFRLSIANQAQAVLGKENARLIFTFKDGDDSVVWSRKEIKTLSQGEKRALYLLSFIFEVEARKLSGQETLFVMDDVADSFDYKNKHAIVQYLEDLCEVANFHQIILTHNFDFFRTLSSNFVHRERCLMANRNGLSISLTKAEGINNYFIGKWKNEVEKNDCILVATIPFVRNLIEYTKGNKDEDYLVLTSLLHWKAGTDKISVGQYFDIYNRLFQKKLDSTDPRLVKEILFSVTDEICRKDHHDGLNLEDKVSLSMAIRIRAEIFLINELRKIKKEPEYWIESESQFGSLMKEYKTLNSASPALPILEKVSITVSSNIHLNSFMYEPILDLTIHHLIKLYGEVDGLKSL